MKPRPLTILLLLLAGAVVNVGVAWGGWLLVAGPLRARSDRQELDPEARLRIMAEYAPESFPELTDGWSESNAFYTANQLSDAIQHTTEHWRWWVVRERQVGWPARCFASAALETADGRNAGRVVTTSRVLRIGNLFSLPIGPLPFGFALNTLFYAALLWLLFLFAPRTLRRYLRTRRGLCPACAYPVGESPACSECGALSKAVKGRPD